MEYRRTARRHWLFYVVTLAGVAFIIFPLMSTGQNWLRVLAMVLGALFFLGGLLAIVRNWQFGSRLDLATYELVWWEGYPPIDEIRIPLERLRTIHLDDHVGDLTLSLRDTDGLLIAFSEQCAPWPWKDWADKMKANVPHIEIRET